MADSQPNVDGVCFATIARFPGYCFGDDGSIWSSRVKGRAGMRGPWRSLKIRLTTEGYRHVTVIDADGRRVGVTAHRLTLEAFHGPAPSDRAIARHLDGDPGNNRLANLAWGTHSENAYDAIQHGTLRPSGKRVLSPETVRAIRSEYEADTSWGRVMRLARKYGISHSQVKRIVRRLQHVRI